MAAFVARGFDWPLGTDQERRGIAIPPGMWHIGNPYLAYYFLGPGRTNPAYHTGIDTSLEPGGGLGQPIYACANGEIIFARRIPAPSSWGNLVIQRCVLPDGTAVYIRYAHVDPMFVKVGEAVVRGQRIALESNAFGRFYPHLHLDFSPTSALRDHPADWPGLDATRLAKDYIDPVRFIRSNRPMASIEQIKILLHQVEDMLDELAPPPPPPPQTMLIKYVNVDPAQRVINVRSGPSTSTQALGSIPRGNAVTVTLTADPLWVQIADGGYKGGYLYAALLSDSRP